MVVQVRLDGASHLLTAGITTTFVLDPILANYVVDVSGWQYLMPSFCWFRVAEFLASSVVSLHLDLLTTPSRIGGIESLP